MDGYLAHYDPFVEPWVNEKIRMLELGIWRGESLLMWQEYFKNAHITGIDIEPVPELNQPQIRCFQGDQSDLNFLMDVAAEKTWPGGFHFIIDDASHLGWHTKRSFWYLFDNWLLPGGLYAIEDWGVGYWWNWPDGRQLEEKLDDKVIFPSHQCGVVGFIKQLVDEQGRGDVCRGSTGKYAPRSSKFKSITIVPGIVFIRKAL
jgi:SAM-dependent methyltransferase